MLFPLRGSERDGLVSLEVKRKQVIHSHTCKFSKEAASMQVHGILR